MSGTAAHAGEAELEGLLACVHCGLCLPVCPTYRVLGDENDSPRGRLYLMRGRLERPEAVRGAFGLHIDRCLGCRACEVVCPAGVPYGALLERARADVAAERRGASRLTRLSLRALAGGPASRAMYAALRFLRVTGLVRAAARGPRGRAATAAGMLDATRPRALAVAGAPHAAGPARALPARPPRTRPRRRSYVLLEGCVMRGLFGHVQRATRRALAAYGFEERTHPGFGCCGALHAHAGLPGEARRLARRNIAAFERSGAELLITDSAGCGAALREYGAWLREDPEWAERAERLSAHARDVSEPLAAVAEEERTVAAEAHGPLAGTGPGVPPPGPGPVGRPLRIAYDAPCHLLHAQRVDEAPLAALRTALDPDRARVEPLPSAAECCGGAGIYALLQPDLSARVLDRKLEEIRSGGYDAVVTGNPGCIMQIGAGLAARGIDIPVLHPVELLADPRLVRARAAG